MAGRSTDVASAYDARAVTKSDATVVPTFRGLYVGGAGDVAIRMASGASITFVAVPVGSLMTVQGDMVLSTGTTATNIVALY